VLEDDYDGEFRYDIRPTASLQSLDRHGCVLYVGTASKLLFPALRCGWLVVPPGLASAFVNAKAVVDSGSATLEQLALAEFIRNGHLERHVQSSRKRYAKRREALLDVLEDQLGDRVRVLGASAGLHVLLRLQDLPRSAFRALAAECRKRGVGVYSATRFYLKPPRHAELLLGYTALRPARIAEGVRRLREALDSVCKG
jgi:GntR family transcriptional regulator/MocR family aminotransferase